MTCACLPDITENVLTVPAAAALLKVDARWLRGRVFRDRPRLGDPVGCVYCDRVHEDTLGEIRKEIAARTASPAPEGTT